MSLRVLHHLCFSRTMFIKSLSSFFCAFILLTVSILSSHGSALPDDFSNPFSDRVGNLVCDIGKTEEGNNDSVCEEIGYCENGSNGIINHVVDEKDANEDYTDFNYSVEFIKFLNNTNPLNPDFDADGMLDGYEVRYGFNPLNPNDAGQPPICPS